MPPRQDQITLIANNLIRPNSVAVEQTVHFRDIPEPPERLNESGSAVESVQADHYGL